MSGYVIVEIEVTDPTAFEEYRRQAAATVAAHGGKYLVRGGAAEAIEGGPQPQRIVVLEFESVASARAWWNSEEYQEPKTLRQRCANTRMILVEGM